MSDLRTATLDWTDGLSFTGGGVDGPTIVLDGDGKVGPSPMVALLLAVAGCSGADVVSILEKKRVQLHSCRIEAIGRRAADHPRRYVELKLRFHLAGEGLTMVHAERAVELSVTKYCSVLKSLDPAIAVEHEIVLN